MESNKYDANEYGTKLVKDLVSDCKFDFPKSLWNVYDCVYAVVGNDKNAVILDYHAGSGTTAHAVLQLNKEDGGNRKFILCEQMDYVNTVTCPRVQKVIEQQGGGSFVYCELAQNTERYKNEIQNADDDKALALWRELKQSPYVSYRVDFQKTNKEEFTALPLEGKKEILKSLIDKNTLYIPYADSADADYKVSKADKALTNKFYGL